MSSPDNISFKRFSSLVFPRCFSFLEVITRKAGCSSQPPPRHGLEPVCGVSLPVRSDTIPDSFTQTCSQGCPFYACAVVRERGHARLSSFSLPCHDAATSQPAHKSHVCTAIRHLGVPNSILLPCAIEK